MAVANKRRRRTRTKSSSQQEKISRVDRLQLLNELEAVAPGIDRREIVEQSNHFIFQGGKVKTYNDEIACVGSHSLGKKFTGAVQATKLLEILRKLDNAKDDKLDFEITRSELRFSAGNKSGGVGMDKEITNPVYQQELPDDTEWSKLPDDFEQAIRYVSKSASRVSQMSLMTCVHILPKWIEAFDNQSISRYRLATGFPKHTCLRASSISQIADMQITDFCLKGAWAHFRNDAGTILSCRRWENEKDLESFANTSQYLKIADAEPIHIPRSVSKAADKAEVFSTDNSAENPEIMCNLSPNKITITGRGVSGWYREVIRLEEYKGRDMAFRIDPKLLKEIFSKTEEQICEVNADRLRVKVGKLTWVTCLGRVE